MFASIREYQTRSALQLTARVQEGLLPILTKLPGFVACYVLDAGDGVWSCMIVSENPRALEECARTLEEWTARKAPDLLLGGPQVTTGELVVSHARQLGWESRKAA